MSVEHVRDQLLDARSNFTQGREAQQEGRDKFEEASPRFTQQARIREEAEAAATDVTEGLAKALTGLTQIAELFSQGKEIGVQIKNDGADAKGIIAYAQHKAHDGHQLLRKYVSGPLEADMVALQQQIISYGSLSIAVRMEEAGDKITVEFSEGENSVRNFIEGIGSIATAFEKIPILGKTQDKAEERTTAEKGAELASEALEAYDSVIAYTDERLSNI